MLGWFIKQFLWLCQKIVLKLISIEYAQNPLLQKVIKKAVSKCSSMSNIAYGMLKLINGYVDTVAHVCILNIFTAD